MSMVVSEPLSASLEDYLEVIFRIVSTERTVRAKDIAKQLGVRSASVTGAFQILAKKHYINYAPYEMVTLTSEGREEAKKIIRRHEALRDFFVGVLGIKEATAEEGACKLEHNTPKPIVDRLIEFMAFLEGCPPEGRQWVQEFIEQCDLQKSKNSRARTARNLRSSRKNKSVT